MRLLLAEDEAAMSEALKDILIYHKYQVDTVDNGEDALAYAQVGEYDGIILDIMMPKMDGLQVLSVLRGRGSRTPVLLLTARGEVEERIRGLDAGADDYLTKPFGVMELISRVKALLRRVGGMEDEKFLRVGILFIDDEKHVAYVDDKHIELTYKEYELLKYLTINQGIVLSRDNLMEKIWSSDYEGESRTLDVHIKTLRQKLGKAGSYIKTVRNVGYFIDLDTDV